MSAIGAAPQAALDNLSPATDTALRWALPPMPEAHVDFETRSPVDLKTGGIYKYAAHPETQVLCACYAIGDGAVQTWFPGQPMPADLRAHVEAGGTIVAHNAQFERNIWRFILGPRHGWAVPCREQYDCTAARAAAMALPRDLDGVARVLGLRFQKDAEGYKLMLRMCKPQKRGPYWFGGPAELARLAAYCARDVEVERAASHKLFKLSPLERQIWLLDSLINDRGIGIDVDTVTAAKAVTEQEAALFAERMREATGWRVLKPSQRQKLADWLGQQGVEVEGLRKNHVVDMLAREDLSPAARQALEIRQEAAKSSTAKLKAILERVEADGRMRENLLYHGAGTGRWAGKGAQLQNLPRPSRAFKKVDPDGLAEDLQRLPADFLRLLYYSPLTLISDALRSLLIAEDGKEFITADFSNIEGRVLAWLVGETWKLEAFRAFDRGEGPDLYKVAAAATFGCAIEDVSDDQRQVGKVEELSLGYQGGVNAFQTMAAGYGVSMAPAYPVLWANTDFETRDWIEEGYQEAVGRGSELAREEWIASEITKRNWRAKHPATVKFWETVEETVHAAVANPGQSFACGPVVYLVAHDFLWCRLPSGRCLAYARPFVRDAKTPWGALKPTVHYWGIDSKTKQWSIQKGYGGLWTENIVQAIARDLMANGMLELEAGGYPVVLTVHDEVIAEVPVGFGSLADFILRLCRLPSWAAGCPVVAAGWRGRRYRKG